MKKRRLRLSNSGFSLIELLIAIAILAVISIPMLQGFIVTHRTTMKALELQGATLAAQNIMETLHADTVEEIKARYGAGEETDEGTRIFVEDITEGNVHYDAVIELAVTGNDAVLASPVTFDEAQDIRMTVPDVSGSTRRIITVTIAATGENVRTKLTVTTNGSEIASEEWTHESDAMLRNLFLHYTPNYASTAATYDEMTFEYADTIRIDNPSGYPVRLVIVKNRTQGAQIADAERAYKVRLDARFLQGETMEVYTNLNSNIGARRNERYETLPHQTYCSDNVRLLPLEGVSAGSGSFYETRVSVYSRGALEDTEQNILPLVTLSNTEG